MMVEEDRPHEEDHKKKKSQYIQIYMSIVDISRAR